MSEYKSRQQREADAKLTEAKAEQARVAAQSAKAELGGTVAASETRRLAEQVKQQRLQQQMDEQMDVAAERAAARRAKRAEAQADQGVAFKRLVKVFVALAMAGALPAQFSYFLGLHKPGEQNPGVAWLMGPLPLVAELGAWVSVYGTSWARRKGLTLAPFWALTGLLAGFSAWLNFRHGTADYGPVAGWALALSSVAGPLMWEVQEYLDGLAALEVRTRKQRADDKKSAQEKAEAVKQAAEHEKKRARLFPDVHERFTAILAAHPLGTVERETAWAQAWTDTHRAPLGVTADTYKARVDAEARLAEVLNDGGSSVYKELDSFLWDTLRGGEEGDSGAPFAGSPRGPRTGPSESAMGLGGKGKQASSGGRQEGRQKPLEPEHLKAVRDLADLLASVGRTVSTADVKKVIGGGRTEYLVRLRQAVEAERAEQQGGEDR